MPASVNPWDDMPTPSNGPFSTKLVNSGSVHEFKWVKDISNNIGFAITLNQKINRHINIPQLENATIGIQPDGKTLAVFLKNQELTRQFRIFCEDCADTVDRKITNNTDNVLDVLVAVFLKWKKLFDGSSEKTLSKSVEIGLIGELLIVKSMLMEGIEPRVAVMAWNGPKGHEQDFLLNGSLIEVKCQLSSNDRVVTITSLEQLDGISGQIYLVHLGISLSNKQTTISFSLPSLTNDILERISGDNYVADTLLGKLELAGYSHDDREGFDYYIESFNYVFKVDEDFPKIIRRDVPQAIERCSYKLATTQLQKWEIGKNQLLPEILQ